VSYFRAFYLIKSKSLKLNNGDRVRDKARERAQNKQAAAEIQRKQ